MFKLLRDRTLLQTTLCASLTLGCLALTSPNVDAAPEKGSKKCSDSIDNDNDGLIDQEDPGCTSDTTDAPTAPLTAVVVDATGKVLGTPTPDSTFEFWEDIFVSTPLDVAAKMNAFKLGLTGKQGLFFDQPNCTGNSYVEAAQAESLYVHVVQAGRNPDAFYLPDTTVPPTTVTVLSLLDLHGDVCIEQNGPLSVHPAVSFDVTYQPPLKLTFR